MENADISEEILKEICYSNGMKYSKLSQEGLSCLSLEMYFTGFTRFIEMNNFPNLQHLCIVGQPLERIENLSSLNKLLELWIVECDIKEIVGLDNCLSLRKLYLYSNKISKIENLDTLTCLKVLHLNNNQIRTIQGLDMLMYLEDLNLAENLIDCVGSSMKNLVNLVTLELSGNPLFCLQDLRNLVHLKKLVSLSLKSCLFKSCPVTNLSNYSSFMVYHFPQLKHLDEENIGQLGVKATAELIVEKKMRFYRMKKQAIHSNLFQVFQRVEDGYLEKVKPLLGLISHIEANLLIKNSMYELNNTTMMKDLSRCYRRIERYTEERKNLMKECDDHASMQQCYLQIELESAGNVTVTIGNPSYSWFQPCLKLVQSRFCGSDCPRGLGSEIFVTQIARIENSMVLDRFHFYVNSELHQEEASYWPAIRTHSSKKNVDYLFHVWKEGMQSDEELVEILSNGMKGHNCHLSNSIQIANAVRLPSKRGKLILCRVFLGRSAPYEGSLWPTIDSFPNDLDSLYQAKQSLHETSMELIRDPTLSSSPLLVSLCNCADKQMHWFIKEANFICPEYIVDFEYHSKAGLPDKLEERLQQFALPMVDKINQLDELRQSSDKGINDLFKPGVELSISVIELDLSKESLSQLEGIGAFRALMRLVVSHNTIRSLKGLSSLNSLQELDASHNHICNLHHVNDMFSLKILNLSFNLLHSPYSDLLTLKHQTPNLTQLNLSFNPYKKISVI